jgi:release factor glutamine methyltransferase
MKSPKEVFPKAICSPEVYHPAEDSWLLEESILEENLLGKKCLDLGTGSGIQSIAMLKAEALEVLAVDINPLALEESKKNVENFMKGIESKSDTQYVGHFQQAFEIRESNLFSNLKEKFDFIAFNPPYVPSDGVKWVDLDGGKNGREVIDKFLSSFSKHLTNTGVLLLLVSSLNKPKQIEEKLKKMKFDCKVVGKKKLFFEELQVLRIKRM